MSANFYDLQKYAATGQASSEMTHYDKMLALAMAGGKIETLTGVPPLSFKANGKPLISLSMLGNGQQTGMPSPDNPVMPEFVGVRTGNLFDMSDFSLLQVTLTAYRYGTSMGVLPQGSYTFNATKSEGAQSIYLTAKFNGVYSQTTISSVPFTFIADGESEYIIRTANNTGTTWDAEKYSDMMLNTGSTALPYAPFGYKMPITCGGTTTPIHLGDTPTVRRIKKLTLDGSETLYWYGRNGYVVINDGLQQTLAPYCDILPGTTLPSSEAPDSVKQLKMNTENISCAILFKVQSGFSSVGDFRAWLEEHTPTVWYVIAEPTTGIVNEPLCKIGNYADELHITDDDVTIPTVKGSNTLTVDTDLQPSEMTIKYRE